MSYTFPSTGIVLRQISNRVFKSRRNHGGNRKRSEGELYQRKMDSVEVMGREAGISSGRVHPSRCKVNEIIILCKLGRLLARGGRSVRLRGHLGLRSGLSRPRMGQFLLV